MAIKPQNPSRPATPSKPSPNQNPRPNQGSTHGSDHGGKGITPNHVEPSKPWPRKG